MGPISKPKRQKNPSSAVSWTTFGSYSTRYVLVTPRLVQYSTPGTEQSISFFLVVPPLLPHSHTNSFLVLPNHCTNEQLELVTPQQQHQNKSTAGIPSSTNSSIQKTSPQPNQPSSSQPTAETTNQPPVRSEELCRLGDDLTAIFVPVHVLQKLDSAPWWRDRAEVAVGQMKLVDLEPS